MEIIYISILGSKEKVQWHQTDESLVLSILEEKLSKYAFFYKIKLKES
jgi:hypothetical protein